MQASALIVGSKRVQFALGVGQQIRRWTPSSNRAAEGEATKKNSRHCSDELPRRREECGVVIADTHDPARLVRRSLRLRRVKSEL